MTDEVLVKPVLRRTMAVAAVASDAPVASVPSGAYGTLADAVRDASATEGGVVFTVKNASDRHELWRLLSGQKHRRKVAVDASQTERVTWKPAEAV